MVTLPRPRRNSRGWKDSPQVSARNAEGPKWYLSPGVVRVKRVTSKARLLGFQTLLCHLWASGLGSQPQSSGFFECGTGLMGVTALLEGLA